MITVTSQAGITQADDASDDTGFRRVTAAASAPDQISGPGPGYGFIGPDGPGPGPGRVTVTTDDGHIGTHPIGHGDPQAIRPGPIRVGHADLGGS